MQKTLARLLALSRFFTNIGLKRRASSIALWPESQTLWDEITLETSTVFIFQPNTAFKLQLKEKCWKITYFRMLSFDSCPCPVGATQCWIQVGRYKRLGSRVRHKLVLIPEKGKIIWFNSRLILLHYKMQEKLNTKIGKALDSVC